ncbi:alk-exo [Oxyplax ochracea nucleopolyhedrovirus]|uniref:Alk-exo n=1 Tax=Oxyplax ochracea nucleopolyhedrovirus TaxID=2083176 RepID=A0A2L0WTZ0_9ABAC|nr:alk-exo [Oxyplax ochracea nucleopolyhedrovirus]AVA31119.1 alk-exo [Oxyplax ochracea nucleopolyhedrovirus]
MPLNQTQELILKKYKFDYYVKNINMNRKQLEQWRFYKEIDPKPLTLFDITNIEKATRGQINNELWNLLRLDRNTASATSCNNNSKLNKPALFFGNMQESFVKKNFNFIFDCMREKIEIVFGERVLETVSDSGMFFSELGLHAASPDAYFLLKNDIFIPVEIKCPYNYRDTTVEQMRINLGSKKNRYCVKHTALSVNKVGEPIFEMVKSNAHHRQMQRQMYVMKSPFGFYVVKFKNDIIIVTVLRDEQFFKAEKIKETNAYVAFAMENSNSARFCQFKERKRSFEIHENNHNFTTNQIIVLAQSNLYLDYGHLKCAFCVNFKMDSRDRFEDVMMRHSVCEASKFLDLSSKQNDDS